MFHTLRTALRNIYLAWRNPFPPHLAAKLNSPHPLGGSVGSNPKEDLSKLTPQQIQQRIDELRASLIVAQQAEYQQHLNRVQQAATVVTETQGQNINQSQTSV